MSVQTILKNDSDIYVETKEKTLMIQQTSYKWKGVWKKNMNTYITYFEREVNSLYSHC